MLLNLRNKNNKLVIKDILDIDFNMSVKEKDGKYRIAVNNSYYFDEDFDNEKDAEKQMLKIADSRNSLENELRNF